MKATILAAAVIVCAICALAKQDTIQVKATCTKHTGFISNTTEKTLTIVTSIGVLTYPWEALDDKTIRKYNPALYDEIMAERRKAFEEDKKKKGLVEYQGKWITPLDATNAMIRDNVLVKYQGKWITPLDATNAMIRDNVLVKYQGKWITPLDATNAMIRDNVLVKYQGKWITPLDATNAMIRDNVLVKYQGKWITPLDETNAITLALARNCSRQTMPETNARDLVSVQKEHNPISEHRERQENYTHNVAAAKYWFNVQNCRTYILVLLAACSVLFVVAMIAGSRKRTLKEWKQPLALTDKNKPYPRRVIAVWKMTLMVLLAFSIGKGYALKDFSLLSACLLLVLINAFLYTYCSLPKVFSCDGRCIGSWYRLRFAILGVAFEFLLVIAFFGLPIIACACMALGCLISKDIVTAEYGPGLSREPLIIIPAIIALVFFGSFGTMKFLLAPARNNTRLLNKYYMFVAMLTDKPYVNSGKLLDNSLMLLSRFIVYIKQPINFGNCIFIALGSILGFPLFAFGVANYYMDKELRINGRSIMADVTTSTLSKTEQTGKSHYRVKYA